MDVKLNCVQKETNFSFQIIRKINKFAASVF